MNFGNLGVFIHINFKMFYLKILSNVYSLLYSRLFYCHYMPFQLFNILSFSNSEWLGVKKSTCTHIVQVDKRDLLLKKKTTHLNMAYNTVLWWQSWCRWTVNTVSCDRGWAKRDKDRGKTVSGRQQGFVCLTAPAVWIDTSIYKHTQSDKAKAHRKERKQRYLPCCC